MNLINGKKPQVFYSTDESGSRRHFAFKSQNIQTSASIALLEKLDAKYTRRIDSFLASLQKIEEKHISKAEFREYFDVLAKIITDAASENKRFKFEFTVKEDGFRPAFYPDSGGFKLSLSGSTVDGVKFAVSIRIGRTAFYSTRIAHSLKFGGFESNTVGPFATNSLPLSDSLFREYISIVAESALNFDGKTFESLNC